LNKFFNIVTLLARGLRNINLPAMELNQNC